MATKYPAQIDNGTSLPTLTTTSTVAPASVNILRDAIVAIETSLGVKPQGIYSTVRARLDVIENILTGGGTSLSLAGDVTGSLSTTKVVALQGNAVHADTLSAATDGYILTWNNLNSYWTAKPAPVGFSAGGDLSGTNTSQTLISISKLNVVTLEKYGAVGNGVTDDSAAMLSALAAVSGGGTIQLGANKTYLLSASAPYSIPAGVTIVGYGDSSVVKTATNNALFIPSGDHTTFRNFRILGSGALATNQIGIANQNLGAPAGSGFHWMRVDGVVFDSLGGAGVLTFQIPAPIATVTPYFTTIITGCRAWQCGIGLWLLGEYSTVSAIQIDGCGVGIECEGGNQVYSGGTITACTTGFKLDGGGNDAHGVVCGLEINHNTTNLFVWNNEANGEKFVDCMFYSGDILLQSTHGVQFIGCQIDVNNYYFDGSIGTVFDNCTFPQSAGTNTIYNNFNGHASTTRWASNNVDLNGLYPGFIIAANDGTLWQHYFDGYIVASNLAGNGAGYAAVDNIGRLTFTATTAIPSGTAKYFPFLAGVAITNSTSLFVVLGAGEFNPLTQWPGAKSIKLQILLETTGPTATVRLYNYSSTAVVTGSTLTTSNTTTTLLTTGDLTSNLTNGSAIYQVQFEMAAGGLTSDFITCSMARFVVQY